MDVKISVLSTLPAAVKSWLLETPKAAHRATLKAVILVERAAKQNVTGRFLKVRTGRGRASITHAVEQTPTGFRGVVGSNVTYMAAHEFGATIPAHIVHVRHAKALHWQKGGVDFFAKWVSIPTFKLPERPWLRTALAESQAKIVQFYQDEYNRAMGAS